MVLAQRVNVDILHNNHLPPVVVVVVRERGRLAVEGGRRSDPGFFRGEERVIGDGGGGLVVPLGEEEEGFCPAGGGFEEALAVGVLADALEDGGAGRCHLLQSVVVAQVWWVVDGGGGRVDGVAEGNVGCGGGGAVAAGFVRSCLLCRGSNHCGATGTGLFSLPYQR